MNKCYIMIQLAAYSAIFSIFTNTFPASANLASSFVIGQYIIVGKCLDSDKTYTGKVEIFTQNGVLQVKRVIGNVTTVGSGLLERAAVADTDVFRIRFIENSIKYEETCLVNSDLDNYARITCYLYKPGVKTTKPGLEAFFIEHNRN